MKKATLPLFILIISFASGLQRVNAQDAFVMNTQFLQEGKVKYAEKELHYGDMEGTPYLYDGWIPGSAKLSDGKTYNNVLLKYDEIQDMPIFKYAEQDSALKFALQPVEFTLNFVGKPGHFVNGFKPADDADMTSFYLVLSDGNLKLLKRTVKRINKRSGYSSTDATIVVNENTTYYLAKNKMPVKIKNDNKAVIAALSDKSEKIKQYISDNKMNVKKDDDFARVVDYYNSL